MVFCMQDLISVLSILNDDVLIQYTTDQTDEFWYLAHQTTSSGHNQQGDQQVSLISFSSGHNQQGQGDQQISLISFSSGHNQQGDQQISLISFSSGRYHETARFSK